MTKTYAVQQDTPRLGKAGTTVVMTRRQAKYWVRAGVLAEADKTKTGKTKT